MVNINSNDHRFGRYLSWSWYAPDWHSDFYIHLLDNFGCNRIRIFILQEFYEDILMRNTDCVEAELFQWGIKSIFISFGYESYNHLRLSSFFDFGIKLFHPTIWVHTFLNNKVGIFHFNSDSTSIFLQFIN